MRPVLTLLCLLLLLACLSTYVLLIPEPANGHGVPHHTFAGMNQVGDAVAQTGPVFTAACLLGLLIYGVASTLLYIGVPAGKRSSTFRAWHLCATLLMMGMWLLLLFVYHRYLYGSDPMIVYGFPLPTLIMLLGVWMAPFAFTLIYAFGFRRFIFTDKDEARFNALMEQKRS